MSLIFEGEVVTGVKQGAVFISRYEQKIRDACGFNPFPGTLNVKLKEEPSLPEHSNFISSWTERGYEYGAVWCYPCTINGLQAALLVPEKAEHGVETVEIISPFCLRTRLGLKNGRKVRIEIP